MNRKGQTTVEFAMTAFILFAVLFALIDFAVMFFVNLTMQHAVREGARYAITGQGGNNGAQRRKALVDKIKECSYGLYEKNANPRKDPEVSVVVPNSGATFSNYTGTPVNDTGSPNEIIVVKLTYSWPLLTPILAPFFQNGRYSFVVRATMRHEPWEDE
jgi:Flp pilus assembly protein TadG